MKNLDFDIWVVSHASQFDLHKKRKPKDQYNPKVFMNKKEYLDELYSLEEISRRKNLNNLMRVTRKETDCHNCQNN